MNWNPDFWNGSVHPSNTEHIEQLLPSAMVLELNLNRSTIHSISRCVAEAISQVSPNAKIAQCMAFRLKLKPGYPGPIKPCGTEFELQSHLRVNDSDVAEVKIVTFAERPDAKSPSFFNAKSLSGKLHFLACSLKPRDGTLVSYVLDTRVLVTHAAQQKLILVRDSFTIMMVLSEASSGPVVLHCPAYLSKASNTLVHIDLSSAEAISGHTRGYGPAQQEEKDQEHTSWLEIQLTSDPKKDCRNEQKRRSREKMKKSPRTPKKPKTSHDASETSPSSDGNSPPSSSSARSAESSSLVLIDSQMSCVAPFPPQPDVCMAEILALQDGAEPNAFNNDVATPFTSED